MRWKRWFTHRKVVVVGLLGCVLVGLLAFAGPRMQMREALFESETTPTGTAFYVDASEPRASHVSAKRAKDGGGEGGGQRARQAAQPERKITRKGALQLRVNDVAAFLDDGARLATALGGFVIRSHHSERDSTLVLSVPAASFEGAMQSLGKAAVAVENSTIESEDVTKRYFDLESTLRNYRAEEQQYLAILKQAYQVRDVMLVTEKLIEVRERIEITAGSFRFLQQEIAMSTIHVTVRRDAPLMASVRWQPSASARLAYEEMLRGFVAFGDLAITVLFRLPVFLLWLVTLSILLYAAWRMLSLARRRLAPARITPAS